MARVAHVHAVIRHPAGVFSNANVVVAMNFTRRPFWVNANVAGVTA